MANSADKSPLRPATPMRAGSSSAFRNSPSWGPNDSYLGSSGGPMTLMISFGSRMDRQRRPFSSV